MKKNNSYQLKAIVILSFVVILLLLFLKSRPNIYRINPDYSGPCMIYISDNSNFFSFKEEVTLLDGLGHVSRFSANKAFSIRTTDDQELTSIAIGAEKKTESDQKYIFQLTKGMTSTSCSSSDVKMIKFYYCTRDSFLTWQKKYDNIFDVFTSRRIDWCNYYKSISEELPHND